MGSACFNPFMGIKLLVTKTQFPRTGGASLHRYNVKIYFIVFFLKNLQHQVIWQIEANRLIVTVLKDVCKYVPILFKFRACVVR